MNHYYRFTNIYDSINLFKVDNLIIKFYPPPLPIEYIKLLNTGHLKKDAKHIFGLLATDAEGSLLSLAGKELQAKP